MVLLRNYSADGGFPCLIIKRSFETALASNSNLLYHLGLKEKMPRNSLSNANAKRDWRIYHDFFYKLLARCRDLTPKHRFKFKNPLHAFDATTRATSPSS